MTEQTICRNCDGTGHQWMAPYPINPFNVRLPQLASMVERRTCWHCRGTGCDDGEQSRPAKER
jgi:hypothetical protein